LNNLLIADNDESTEPNLLIQPPFLDLAVFIEATTIETISFASRCRSVTLEGSAKPESVNSSSQ
jgi:hypothetical protein